MRYGNSVTISKGQVTKYKSIPTTRMYCGLQRPKDVIAAKLDELRNLTI
jgi:hypothetical protein